MSFYNSLYVILPFFLSMPPTPPSAKFWPMHVKILWTHTTHATHITHPKILWTHATHATRAKIWPMSPTLRWYPCHQGTHSTHATKERTVPTPPTLLALLRTISTPSAETLKERLKQREKLWIMKLETLVAPYGLNQDLNWDLVMKTLGDIHTYKTKPSCTNIWHWDMC